MQNLITIDSNQLPVIEWQNVRVVTTETLAKGYAISEAGIRKNLSRNRNRFIEGVHVFKLEGKELHEFRNRVTINDSVNKHTTSLTLWTEKGAARMSKIVDTDEAWAFFEKMENAYFRPIQYQKTLPGNYIQALEALVESEKEKLVISDERDKAIRTKSQISRTREASAMGKLSVATRKNQELTERLGESVKHATITAVKNATGKEYKFAPLRRWCRENQMEATEVPDIRYGQVKSWPAESWLQVYGINLKSLFANSQRIH
ncbi:ORF6N domain-containing protein [Arsenophonus nasoniae]|uniref:ORF6N domain protein n=3 Tax=Arsenophonus TaxID=637 RepID=A0A4P7KW65_9GAMM|nr:ORF6N domain-containing protein [Arsenophonus nasoniae]QBY44455.1 ORF6N domain protein [Arsenophonus nasoniae]WGM04710.1 ORF6N domain-containing protein [Arsenophonus nasoniae]WGM09826.1 ORF6N domain-containing protein [Arsenophonus nasoniae]WGM14545.1 ORF6N domain-containing protein [Arsenophonus nasoniae]